MESEIQEMSVQLETLWESLSRRLQERQKSMISQPSNTPSMTNATTLNEEPSNVNKLQLSIAAIVENNPPDDKKIHRRGTWAQQPLPTFANESERRAFFETIIDLARSEISLLRDMMARMEEDKIERWKSSLKDDVAQGLHQEKEHLAMELVKARERIRELELSSSRKIGNPESPLHIPPPPSPKPPNPSPRTPKFSKSWEPGAAPGGSFPLVSLPSWEKERERERLAMESYAEMVTLNLTEAQDRLSSLSSCHKATEERLEAQGRVLRELSCQLARERRGRDSLARELEEALIGWTAALDKVALSHSRNAELEREVQGLRSLEMREVLGSDLREGLGDDEVGEEEVEELGEEEVEELGEEEMMQRTEERRDGVRRDLTDLLRLESVGKWLDIPEPSQKASSSPVRALGDAYAASWRGSGLVRASSQCSFYEGTSEFDFSLSGKSDEKKEEIVKGFRPWKAQEEARGRGDVFVGSARREGGQSQRRRHAVSPPLARRSMLANPPPQATMPAMYL